MLPIIAVILIIGVISFIIFAANKKKQGEDLGESGKAANE